MGKSIGKLTAGGDSPGLDAVIRDVGKAANSSHDVNVVAAEERIAALQERDAVLTGLEARVTILGHVERGGTPLPVDRLLATRLGTAAAHFVANGVSGVMVAVRGEETVAVPLEEAAGKRKMVPLDHPWMDTARSLGVGFGD